MDERVAHCVAKVGEIVASGMDGRRAVFQLGYNLGRLSELTGRGRGSFWDRWKGAVDAWDRTALEALARGLRDELVAEAAGEEGKS